MIDEKNFELLEPFGYTSKTAAYDTIRSLYSDLDGVTTYYYNGMWYIVISKLYC